MEPKGWPPKCCLPKHRSAVLPYHPQHNTSAARTREDLEKRWAGVKAQNAADRLLFAGPGPSPRVGSNLPKRCRAGPRRDSLGCRAGPDVGGVLIPPVSPGGPACRAALPTLDKPIWALCAELESTVVQHAGAGSTEMRGGQRRQRGVCTEYGPAFLVGAPASAPSVMVVRGVRADPDAAVRPTEQGTCGCRRKRSTRRDGAHHEVRGSNRLREFGGRPSMS